jgi:hypothetical protein
MPTIQGSLPLALGVGAVTGSIRVTWNSFTDSFGIFYTAGQQTVTIQNNGSYSFTLAANQDSMPLTYYNATYFLGPTSTSYTEQWIVPVTTAALTIGQIKLNSSVPPIPFQIPVSQLFAPTGSIGEVLVHNGQGYTSTAIQSIYPFAFAAQTSVTIPLSDHAQGYHLLVRVYDSAGNELDPALVCDPSSGLVQIFFNEETTGSGFIYGGLGRSLPNFSKTFLNVQTATIPAAQHRFLTPHLAVEVYGGDGTSIKGSGTVQIGSNYSVTVSFATPQTFRVVVIGCLGATPASSGSSGGSGSGLSLTTASTVATPGALEDGTALVVSSAITLAGATPSSSITLSSNPALPAGVLLMGKVTATNTVQVELFNLSGAPVSLPTTAFYATLLS